MFRPQLLTLLSIAFTVTVHAQLPARRPVPGAPAEVTAFVDVNVIPMDTERQLARQTVLVQNGWIIALGPSSMVKVPSGAVRIDGQGKFLIPGLADMHAHVGNSYEPPLIIDLQARPPEPKIKIVPDSAAERRLFLWVAAGVTTIRNLDHLDGPPFILKGPDLLRLRARAAAGELWSPRMYVAGQWAPLQYTNIWSSQWRTSPPDAPMPRLDSVAAYIAAYKAAGYDFIKVHEETPAVVEALLAAARQVGIPVVGHADHGRLRLALTGGMYSIEHLEGYAQAEGYTRHDPASVGNRALAEETRRAGVWNCPTLQLGGPSPALVKALQDAGAGILLGTDSPLASGYGEGVHLELELLVKAGLTPYQALATGTTNVALYFKTVDESGTIAAGKRADLVLLTGNPLQDIRNTRKSAGVMVGGRWLSPEVIKRRLAAIQAAAVPS